MEIIVVIYKAQVFLRDFRTLYPEKNYLLEDALFDAKNTRVGQQILNTPKSKYTVLVIKELEKHNEDRIQQYLNKLMFYIQAINTHYKKVYLIIHKGAGEDEREDLNSAVRKFFLEKIIEGHLILPYKPMHANNIKTDLLRPIADIHVSSDSENKFTEFIKSFINKQFSLLHEINTVLETLFVVNDFYYESKTKNIDETVLKNAIDKLVKVSPGVEGEEAFLFFRELSQDITQLKQLSESDFNRELTKFREVFNQSVFLSK